MRIPFLQKLTGLPAGQVTGSGPAAEAVRHLLQELPELLLAAVLDTQSGTVLAGLAATRDYQPGAVAGPAGVVLQQLRAATSPDAGLQELVLTLTTQLHVLRPVATGHQLLYLAVDARDTNLAIARQVAAEAAALLGSST